MMKKNYLLFLILILNSLTGFTQTFSVTADTIEGTYDVGQYPSDYNYVTNNSGNDLTLSFDLLTNTLPSNGWSVTLCTHQFCMPSVPSTASFGTLADGAQGYFNVHVGFNGATGTGEISFRVYETNNPSNADTIYFIYHATSSVGLAENSGNINISTFPNPTTDLIIVQGLDNSTAAVFNIYNNTGELVNSDRISSSNEVINVGNLLNGVYFLEIRDQGSVIYSTKLIKN